MNTSAQISRSNVPSRSTALEKFLAVLLGGSALAVIFMVLFSLALTLLFAGRVHPGISVAGVDIGGLPRDDAQSLLRERITYPETGLIVLEYQGKVWTFTPAEMGLVMDYDASIEKAYRFGRTGWPWQQIGDRLSVLQAGKELSPILILDERVTRQVLSLIANEINQEMREASLRLEGVNVVAEPGQIGLMLDEETAIAALKGPMLNLFDTSQVLPVNEFHPVILDASDQAQTASSLLAQPLTLRVSGNPEEKLGPWKIEPAELAGMMVIDRVSTDNGDQFVVKLEENTLFNVLYPLAPNLIVKPENARFIFNDDTRELEVVRSAVIGRELLVEESIDHINAKLAEGHHTIDLVFDFTNPEVTDDATAADLNITELVSAETTWFYGSDSARMQNIETAAGQFHGILIAPGETFSMVENIGDISLDTGYAEAWIIYGDRTVKGVGGGVCQVSTTLFRTVFFGGYPVVERWPHSYRVTYYELAQSGGVNERMAGLDATVYAPIVDFKFTNDTDSWLLMETYVNIPNRSLTWKFYSTSDGRTVDWHTTGLTDVKKPPFPVYEENKDLKKGEIKKVDWAVEGATVTVTRTVTRGSETLYNDTFKTTYEPWAAVCQYGPGTEDYPPKDDERDRFTCKVKGE